ncbi:MAG: cupin domain-containing protein [Casimicrobiaceae bacterium]
MGKIDVTQIPRRTGSSYPSPHDAPCALRVRQRLGDAAGLSQFGVNLLELPPGAWSSQRHWHSAEDEFVYVVAGEVVLVTDGGEQVLRAGDCAGFPKGAPDGHHLINRGKAATVCLEVGTRATDDDVDYPDIDMVFDSVSERFAHRDGTAYPQKRPAGAAATSTNPTVKAPRRSGR